MGKDTNIVLDREALNAKRPSVFHNLQEARSGLELVLNQLSVFFLDMELDDRFYDYAVSNAERHQVFSPWLKLWEAAFSSFLARNQATLSPSDRKAAMILKAHQTLAEIFAEVDLSLGELGWDAFHDRFAAITDLAVAVLEGSTPADASIIEKCREANGVIWLAPTLTLSFSLGIVDPLYEVCARCRDPALRRRALDLVSNTRRISAYRSRKRANDVILLKLASHPRQECMWSSWCAWKVGKYLMELEEESVDLRPTQSSDIPAERRLEAWLDLSDIATDETHEPRIAFKRALPRAEARSALNPGLFQNREVGYMGLASLWNRHQSVRSDSTASSTLSTATSDSNAVGTIAGSLTFGSPAWIDTETDDRSRELPLIRKTPPQD